MQNLVIINETLYKYENYDFIQLNGPYKSDLTFQILRFLTFLDNMWILLLKTWYKQKMLEQLFIASNSRQFSVDIKNKNYKIKTSYVNPKRTNARAKKTSVNFIISVLIFVENCL